MSKIEWVVGERREMRGAPRARVHGEKVELSVSKEWKKCRAPPFRKPRQRKLQIHGNTLFWLLSITCIRRSLKVKFSLFLKQPCPFLSLKLFPHGEDS